MIHTEKIKIHFFEKQLQRYLITSVVFIGSKHVNILSSNISFCDTFWRLIKEVLYDITSCLATSQS